MGKVILSNENKSIIKTETINRKKFKTKVLVYEKLERGGRYKIQGKFYPPLPAMTVSYTHLTLPTNREV